MKQDNASDVEKLKKWLKNNSAAELAVALGYKSTASVYHWIHRGSLPRLKRVEILQKIKRSK